MAARKSRLHLNSFIPVNQTHDDIVKKIFRPGRFACTITANLQLVGIVRISLCANVAITVVADYCHYHPSHRKLNIASAVATICCATALYFIFCCGYVVKNPSLWVRINILTNFTLSAMTIVAQSMAMEACLTVSHVHKSPGPMALVGGGCLLLSCFTMFLLYRYKELDVQIHDIIQERKLSEDRSVAPSSHKSVVSTIDERKRSTSEMPQQHHHIKANIYVKRKCSAHSICEGCHGGHETHAPKRKTSVYAKHDDGHLASHSQHGRRKVSNDVGGHGHHVYQSKRKVSKDVSVSSGYRHDDEYPHCYKSRRKSSLFTKHY